MFSEALHFPAIGTGRETVKIEDPGKTVEKKIIQNIKEALIREMGRIGEMTLIVEKLNIMTFPKLKLLRSTTYYHSWKISLN